MDIFEWVASVGGVVLAGILVAWLTGLLARMVRLAARCKLAITNIWRSRRPPLDNRFRFVLCCLEGDGDGRDTATVNDAFQEVSGVELVPSARIVKAKGAGDDWRPAMRKQTNAILRTWRGDLAVVGRVEKPREKLSLWFVPREGDGALERPEQQFSLNGVSLVEGFRETLHEQIVAVALSAVSSLANNAARGRVLEEGLKQVFGKLGIILNSGEITVPRQRADLLEAYGGALFALEAVSK